MKLWINFPLKLIEQDLEECLGSLVPSVACRLAACDDPQQTRSLQETGS